jgi:hypothetical protein
VEAQTESKNLFFSLKTPKYALDMKEKQILRLDFVSLRTTDLRPFVGIAKLLNDIGRIRLEKAAIN